MADTVEAALYKIENTQHDSRIPFSGQEGRRFKSFLADHSFRLLVAARTFRSRQAGQGPSLGVMPALRC